MPAAATNVQVSGRSVRVSSPDRVVYEETCRTPAATKFDVAQLYADLSVPLLRQLYARPTALERWPGGVREDMVLAHRGTQGDAFYSKRVPRGAPDFVESATITFPSGRQADEVCPTDPAVAVWAAQMGTITFHPWPVRRDEPDRPDELRIDLDPQPGTSFDDVRRVAASLHGLLDELGMRGFVKTSGNRGLHVYVRIRPEWEFVDVRHAAIALGRELERRAPEQVTTAWWKEERGARVFVDFNQNCRDRTIAGAYSLRPMPGAPISTPVAWDELDDVEPQHFTLFSIRERLADVGDPWETIDDEAFGLERLLSMWEDDVARGLGEMPYPPDHPKMPGEPPRVQPSRKNAANWDA